MVFQAHNVIWPRKETYLTYCHDTAVIELLRGPTRIMTDRNPERQKLQLHLSNIILSDAMCA